MTVCSIHALIRRVGAGIGAAMALALGAGVGSAPAATFADGSVYARVTADRVVLGNGVAERRWSRARLRTIALVDKRRGGRSWTKTPKPDFALSLAGAPLESSAFRVARVAVTRLARGGLRVTMRLAGPPGLQAARTAEAYPGIAGFRTQTVLTPTIPLALAGVTLEQAVVGAGASPEISAFRAGSDWRAPGYTGPPVG